MSVYFHPKKRLIHGGNLFGCLKLLGKGENL